MSARVPKRKASEDETGSVGYEEQSPLKSVPVKPNKQLKQDITAGLLEKMSESESESDSDSDDDGSNDGSDVNNGLGDTSVLLGMDQHSVHSDFHKKKPRAVRVLSPNELICFPLFEAYKRNFGHLDMRSSFIVPSTSDWPEEHHGVKLGQHMYKIRADLKRGDINYQPEEVDRLFDMGFILDPVDDSESRLLQGIEIYRGIHGNVKIPNKYKVAVDDLQWPEELRGFTLGSRIRSIRKKGSKLYDTLVELGLDMTKDKPFHDFERVYTALVFYKEIYGNLDVPFSYVVPENDNRFPPKAHGFKLGCAVKNIKKHHTFKEHKERLTALGMVIEDYDPKTRVVHAKRGRPARIAVGFDAFYGALVAYKLVHGHVVVPKGVVIAREDWRFPEESWGMELGKLVGFVRRQGKWKEHREKLEELGVSYERNRTHAYGNQGNFELFFAALCAFKQIHGHVKVTTTFSVPTDDYRYPEEVWGLKLGSKVSDVRLAGTYKESVKDCMVYIGWAILPVYKRKIDFTCAWMALLQNGAIMTHLLIESYA